MRISPWFFCGVAALLLPWLVAMQAPPTPGLAQVLRAARWQQRLLLIGAPTATQVDFQRQKALLAAAPKGLAERDFEVVEVPYDHLTPADRQCWTQQMGQSLTGFAVVLVGKDGGVKRSSAHPLAPADLFGTVDKMPMRRDEMRQKK